MQAKIPIRMELERWIETLASTRCRFAVSDDAGIARAHSSFHIGPRTLDEHMIWLVPLGSLTGTVGTKKVSLESGSLLWVPPGIEQEFRAAGEAGASFLYVRFHLSAGRREVAPGFPFLIERDAADIWPIVEEIIEESRSASPWADQRQRARFILLFTTLAQNRSAKRPYGTYLNAWQRQEIIRHVHRHIEKRLSSSDLAQLVRLSPGYFSRVFQRTFAYPPKTWLMRERIRLAAMTVSQTNLALKEIAHQFGYRDVFFFSRQFKRVLGRSPGAFRRNL